MYPVVPEGIKKLRLQLGVSDGMCGWEFPALSATTAVNRIHPTLHRPCIVSNQSSWRLDRPSTADCPRQAACLGRLCFPISFKSSAWRKPLSEYACERACERQGVSGALPCKQTWPHSQKVSTEVTTLLQRRPEGCWTRTQRRHCCCRRWRRLARDSGGSIQRQWQQWQQRQRRTFVIAPAQ